MPCSIRKMLTEANQVVQPYLKSLQHFKLGESKVIERLLALLPARFRGDAASGKAAHKSVASPTKRMALRAAAPTRSAPMPPAPAAKQDSILLPKVPPATPLPPSPMIPEVKLDKLLAAQAAGTQQSSPEKSEMDKVGEGMVRSVGDLFANIGGSMDNLFQGEAAKPKSKPRRGIIVA